MCCWRCLGWSPSRLCWRACCACGPVSRESGERSLHAREVLRAHHGVKQVRWVEVVLGQSALQSLQLLVKGKSWRRLWRNSCWSRGGRGSNVVVNCLHCCLRLSDFVVETRMRL